MHPLAPRWSSGDWARLLLPARLVALRSEGPSSASPARLPRGGRPPRPRRPDGAAHPLTLTVLRRSCEPVAARCVTRRTPDAAVRAAGLGERVSEPVPEEGAVGQPGERSVEGPVTQLIEEPGVAQGRRGVDRHAGQALHVHGVAELHSGPASGRSTSRRATSNSGPTARSVADGSPDRRAPRAPPMVAPVVCSTAARDGRESGACPRSPRPQVQRPPTGSRWVLVLDTDAVGVGVQLDCSSSHQAMSSTTVSVSRTARPASSSDTSATP